MNFAQRKLTVLALAVTLAAARHAAAGFIPILFSSVGSTFNYELDFTTNSGGSEMLEAGDFVTIYDLGGAVNGPATNPAGITVPANFTVSTQLVGNDPAGGLVNPTDNASLLNVTYTYTGPTLSADAMFLSTVTAPANYTDATTRPYTSTDKIPAGKNTQIGPVLVPTQAVPEPGTGLIVLGVFAVLVKRKMTKHE